MAKATRKKTQETEKIEVIDNILVPDWNALSIRYVLDVDVALSQLNHMTNWMHDILKTVNCPDKKMLDEMIHAVSGSREILASIANTVECAYDKRVLDDETGDYRKIRPKRK